MSASEKLKALDADMGGEDNEDAAYWLGRKMQDGLLPQIVAVVEAAEMEEEGFQFIGQDTTLTAALAALDQALSGDEP